MALTIQAGQAFGRLSVIGYAQKSGMHRMALCRCACGLFRRARITDLVRGRVDQCADCAKAAAATRGALVRTLPNELGALRRHMDSYRSNAKRKGYAFRLSEGRFIELVKRDCHYCGAAPSTSHTKAAVNGLDRVDNGVGYVEGNVVPACTNCNLAKREMSVEQFLCWVTQVHEKSVQK